MKLRDRALALAPFVLACVAVGQSSPLELGLALFREGKYDAALERFEEAKQAQPANAALDNVLGITETRLGRIDDADRNYQSAIALNPGLADAHKNLGYNYLGLKRYELAEKELKTALALDTSEPFVHYYLAILYLATSREKEAIVHIRPAESILVNDPATALLAVKALLSAGSSGEALQLVELLEQKSSLSAQQEYQVAQLLNERQMYAESAARFARIVVLEPASWQDKYNLALAWVRAKQLKNALPLLASLTAEHAGDAELLANIATTYETAGEHALALEAYQKAIAADSANADRYLDASRLLIDLDRYNDAESVVQHGVSMVADDYPLTVRLGAIEMMRGNRDQARSDYQKAIAEHPELALAYVALAQTYMKEGKDDEALKILTQGRAAIARDFALEYVFGLVSLQLGQQKQALQALENAEQLQPEVVEPHYQLGLLHMQVQEWDAARAEFEQVLKLDPHNAPTYYQLSRTYQRLGKTEKAQEMARQASTLTRTQREEAIRSQELRFGIPGHD